MPQSRIGRKILLFGWLLGLAAGPQAGAAADHPFLHPLFCAHAGWQRGGPGPVWGWSAPGAKITVRFAGRAVPHG